MRDLRFARLAARAVSIGSIEALDDACRRRLIPCRQARNGLLQARVARERGKLRCRIGALRIGKGTHDEGSEVACITHDRIGLDALHVERRHTSLRRARLIDQLSDARRANAVGEGGAEILNPAARSTHVEHVVVGQVPGRIIVGIDDRTTRGIDELRHFRERQDFVRQRAIRILGHGRQPFVAALAVANEVRRQPCRRASLQIFAQRKLATREPRDVAVDVRVVEVLRGRIELEHSGLEVSQIARAAQVAKPCISRVPLDPVYCTLMPTPPATLATMSGP